MTRGDSIVIGYTEDGYVFISGDSKDSAGRPMQVHLMWQAKEAREMGKQLMIAADKCEGKDRIIVMPGAYQ